MKSKAPLVLMEQLVMLLVFALAAALCLQVFVFSAQRSRRVEAESRAAIAVQNAAELTKASRGHLSRVAALSGGSGDDSRWVISYDENWAQTDSGDARYQVIIERTDEFGPIMDGANVYAVSDSEELFRVAVCWQEEVFFHEASE